MAPYSKVSLLWMLSALSAVQAIPTRRQTFAALSPAEISSFKPYTHYAGTAYCKPSTTRNWTCGANCEANPSFVPVASGGDGIITQFWFVGYDPALEEVIVAHEGTDITKIIPALTDLNLPPLPLDPFLFPGLGFLILVHTGFAQTHARSAPHVLNAVTKAMSKYKTSKVTVTGHSLGAAIALLDSVYLPLHLPNATVRHIGYGMPRVGNRAFADYVDGHPKTTIVHVNNKRDPVPIVPPIILGFHHPSGEVHIQESGVWTACPGQDNPSSECIVGSASLVSNNEPDHGGPYDSVEMGC